MTLQVVGAGVGRTGTYSLKLALNQLGLGPCHHMEEVLHHLPRQVPLWMAACNGKPDWQAIYEGYGSAVDWPTAGFFNELSDAYPSAKFVLTLRDPARWADSFSATIYELLTGNHPLPEEMRAWLDMGANVIARCGFRAGLDVAELQAAFTAHNEAVRAAVPARRLLVYRVGDGWGPLCDFLGVPVPAEPFPRTNDRGEFWDRVSGRR